MVCMGAAISIATYVCTSHITTAYTKYREGLSLLNWEKGLLVGMPSAKFSLVTVPCTRVLCEAPDQVTYTLHIAQSTMCSQNTHDCRECDKILVHQIVHNYFMYICT